MTTYSHMPATLVAGDSWAWADPTAYASHPPPDWEVRYILRPVGGGTATTIVATPGDGAYLLGRSATDTASTQAGEYEWTALAYHGATDGRAWLTSGRVTVLPDPAQATGDLRSNAERILAAINATIEGRATKDADAYSIEGRSITRTPLADLLRLQAVYERRVAAERNPGAAPFHYRRIAL